MLDNTLCYKIEDNKKTSRPQDLKTLSSKSLHHKSLIFQLSILDRLMKFYLFLAVLEISLFSCSIVGKSTQIRFLVEVISLDIFALLGQFNPISSQAIKSGESLPNE